jgi:toxoflavin biosynthesis protein ToxD
MSDPKDKGDHPVVQISWHDAMAYCHWLDEVLRGEIKGLQVRLATEAEWEKAARGEYGNEWPWGNEFDPKKCNSSEGNQGGTGTTPVGAYSPQGDSPYGVADMVGNVWEWCHSLYKPYYTIDAGLEDESASGWRVTRGGAFDDGQWNARCASRAFSSPDLRRVNLGFRVVVSSSF